MLLARWAAWWSVWAQRIQTTEQLFNLWHFVLLKWCSQLWSVRVTGATCFTWTSVDVEVKTGYIRGGVDDSSEETLRIRRSKVKTLLAGVSLQFSSKTFLLNGPVCVWNHVVLDSTHAPSASCRSLLRLSQSAWRTCRGVSHERRLAMRGSALSSREAAIHDSICSVAARTWGSARGFWGVKGDGGWGGGGLSSHVIKVYLTIDL